MANSHSFREYARKKEEWHWLVKTAIKKRPEAPYLYADVLITYYFKDSRRRDPDNYSGKFIMDALVKEGIIADDSFDVVSLKVEKGGVDRKHPRTVIEVKERKYDG
jgi:Holliday junction resolvase RusA-like endonuclease